MRALQLETYGVMPSIKQVEEPKVCGPFDVVVAVAAAGVCRTDLHVIEGQFAAAGTSLPLTLGHENVGWVREIGNAVTNLSAGDLVLLHPTPTCGLCPACRAGYDMLCTNTTFPGIFNDGGMAELVLTNARACVKLPPDTDPISVAAHADAGLTAYHAVNRALPLLRPGTSCAVVGVGGLGHIAIQCLAGLSGTHIVAVDRKPDALVLAESLGAHSVVEATDGWVDVAREAVGGDGVDVVIDFVGEAGAEKDCPRLLRKGGSYFIVGYGGTLDVPTIDMILNEFSIVGNLVGSYGDLAELMALHAQGKVAIHTVSFGLDEAADALAALDAGTIPGRAVLVP
jgi:NAD+-dependent secondary alcohol dehydrogenase Adh1